MRSVQSDNEHSVLESTPRRLSCIPCTAFNWYTIRESPTLFIAEHSASKSLSLTQKVERLKDRRICFIGNGAQALGPVYLNLSSGQPLTTLIYT